MKSYQNLKTGKVVQFGDNMPVPAGYGLVSKKPCSNCGIDTLPTPQKELELEIVEEVQPEQEVLEYTPPEYTQETRKRGKK